MPDQPVTGASSTDGQTPSAATSGAGDDAKITMTSQQLADRLARAKPADYDDLKAKAARLDAIEQASKSELDKANDRATKAEQERDAARADALRSRIAAAHGISTAKAADGSPSDADLFLTGSDEKTLTEQAQRLAGRRTQSNRVPGEGTNPTGGGGDLRAFARDLFRHTA